MTSSNAAGAGDPARAPEQRIPAFVNPFSPNGSVARAALTENSAFEPHDLDPRTLRMQIAEAVAEGASRVLVAGGDGTLGTAAAALVGHPTELAVIAAGTLNHFARDHGIPEGCDEAIATALNAAAGPVDVGLVNDNVFLNTASVGMYVAYVRTRERLEKYFGYRFASAIAFLITFLRFRRVSVEINVNGERRQYRTALLFVGAGERELKAPHFGNRIPGGRRGLHVMVLRGRRPARVLTLALAAAMRGIREVGASPDLDSYLVDSCVVTVGRRRYATIGLDGELVRLATPLRFELLRDGLQVAGAVRPADQPAEEA
jgi:diacylglycerol kinase family enzyme